MQNTREGALTAAINRLEEALEKGCNISRLERNRFLSLVESSYNREDLISQKFMTVYCRSYEKKSVWNSAYLTQWLEGRKSETPPMDRTKASTVEDGIGRTHTIGNITMHMDADDKLLYYTVVLKNSDVVEITRDESEKMLSIYSACTLEIVSQYFALHPKEVLSQILKSLAPTKDTVTPPHILKEYSSDEIVQYIIRNKKAGAMANYRKNSVRNLEKTLRDTFKEQAERISLEELIKETVEETSSLLKDRKQFDFGSYIGAHTEISKETYWLVISDLHIGKKDSLPDGTETSTKIINERLRFIKEKLLIELHGKKPNKLKLLILGDILESPMFSGMHGEQFKKMESFGADQIMDAVNALEYFIVSIAKALPSTKVDVDVISGNHDRFAEDRSDDVLRTGGGIVAAFLKKIISEKNVSLVYHEDGVISLNEDGINVIGFHGDNALIKRKSEEIHTVFAKDRNHHSVILNGHYHSFKSEETAHFTKIQMGSICSNDKYENYQLGVRNKPSFLIFKHEKGCGIEWKKVPLRESKK